MAVAPLNPEPGGVRAGAEQALDAFLGGYAQILFSRSRWVGLMLLFATLTSPRMALFGGLSVLLAVSAARAFRLSPDLIASGLFSYNALLVGLGGASLVQPTPMGLGLLAVAVVGSVLVTAAIHSALGASFGLPALTLPFLAVFYLVLGAAPLADVPLRPLTADPLALELGIPPGPRLLLQSLGALFFLPRIDAGAFVLLALIIHSRIGTLLAVGSFTLVAVLRADLFVLSDPTLAIMLGYNCVLIAVALGGIWFVPSPSSFLLAGGGVLLGVMFTLGALPRLAFAGIPLLILPFNLTVFLVLYAMRQRVRDGSPKAVDFLIGTPEENLNYFRTRLARFGAQYFVRLSAPFLGRWVCTQSVEGSITHKGPWRHALDFQVAGEDGRLHRGSGSSLATHYCYRLPVVAVADGVVAKVVDAIPDNPIGDVNLRENWGNLVIVYHAPGLYSLVCHLSPGTIKVREGEPVQRGQTLGLCGSSGRSPVPHLHFQLQATARVGAPTLALELHDVVAGEKGEEVLHGVCIPSEGETIRNVEPEQDIAHLFRFPYGEAFQMCPGHDSDGGGERIVPHIDLYGALSLVSPERRATLFYDQRVDMFTVYDVIGARRSVLHLMHAALSRVPFETTTGMRFRDYLPWRPFLPWILRPLSDFVSPFLPGNGIEMQYVVHRKGREVVVSGESTRLRHRNGPAIVTEALLLDGRGLQQVEVTVRGRMRRAVRAKGSAEATTAPVLAASGQGGL